MPVLAPGSSWLHLPASYLLVATGAWVGHWAQPEQLEVVKKRDSGLGQQLPAFAGRKILGRQELT